MVLFAIAASGHAPGSAPDAPAANYHDADPAETGGAAAGKLLLLPFEQWCEGFSLLPRRPECA